MLVLKMEVRRKGYVVLKKGNEYQRLQDEKRLKRMKYAQYLSPESLSISASKRLDMKKAIGGQIIYMSGTNIAVNH
jgi:hypothetical protein